MMRLVSLRLAATIFLAIGTASGEITTAASRPQEVPQTASVEIILLNTPGLNDERTRWEIVYEFRIANEAMLWEGAKEGKFRDGSDKRVGELIKVGDVKKLLTAAENRKIILQIPLSAEIQARLRNQPRDLFRLNPGTITPEDIRRSREQETRMQSFLFYSIINIYDAKLKKFYTIPASFTWSFRSYPQARFQIKVEVNNDGSYRVNTSLPVKTPSS